MPGTWGHGRRLAGSCWPQACGLHRASWAPSLSLGWGFLTLPPAMSGGSHGHCSPGNRKAGLGGSSGCKLLSAVSGWIVSVLGGLCPIAPVKDAEPEEGAVGMG